MDRERVWDSQNTMRKKELRERTLLTLNSLESHSVTDMGIAVRTDLRILEQNSEWWVLVWLVQCWRAPAPRCPWRGPSPSWSLPLCLPFTVGLGCQPIRFRIMLQWSVLRSTVYKLSPVNGNSERMKWEGKVYISHKWIYSVRLFPLTQPWKLFIVKNFQTHTKEMTFLPILAAASANPPGSSCPPVPVQTSQSISLHL